MAADYDKLGFRAYTCECGFNSRTRLTTFFCAGCGQKLRIDVSCPSRRTTPPGANGAPAECEEVPDIAA